MKVAKTTKLNSKRYGNVFSVWLETHGLDAIDKADRGKLLKIMDNLEPFEEWLNTKTEAERAKWNHPSTVWRISRCKTRGINAVNAKAQAPKPNAEDLPPELADKLEEENDRRDWQRRLGERARKAIEWAELNGDWLLSEPPTKGDIAVVEEAILAWERTLDYLRSILAAAAEEVEAETERSLEAA